MNKNILWKFLATVNKLLTLKLGLNKKKKSHFWLIKKVNLYRKELKWEFLKIKPTNTLICLQNQAKSIFYTGLKIYIVSTDSYTHFSKGWLKWEKYLNFLKRLNNSIFCYFAA